MSANGAAPLTLRGGNGVMLAVFTAMSRRSVVIPFFTTCS